MTTEAPQLNQAELDALLGFASDDDSHVPYMKRTRDWYMALGLSLIHISEPTRPY